MRLANCPQRFILRRIYFTKINRHRAENILSDTNRFCCCDLQDDAYERNDVWREAFVIVRIRYIQPLFVFWQILLRVRFDNRTIRHGLLADSQMNEFAVNRRDDASTYKSSIVQVRLYQNFRTVSLSLAHRTCIALNQIGKYFRKDTVASGSERAWELIGPCYLPSKWRTD